MMSGPSRDRFGYSHRAKCSESLKTPPLARFETWRWFCGACAGMTLAQIEEATGVPFGTILAWSMSDKIPESAYIAVRDFPGEKRRL